MDGWIISFELFGISAVSNPASCCSSWFTFIAFLEMESFGQRGSTTQAYRALLMVLN